jgi:bacteriorhodopsin
MFYVIYTKYAQFTSHGTSTFVYFVIVWGLYGVAALMSYKVKNVMYNILDLFAKNFFGLFLAFKVAVGVF